MKIKNGISLVGLRRKMSNDTLNQSIDLTLRSDFIEYTIGNGSIKYQTEIDYASEHEIIVSRDILSDSNNYTFTQNPVENMFGIESILSDLSIRDALRGLATHNILSDNVILNQKTIDWDMEETHCACCGIQLSPLNRIFDLCEECDEDIGKPRLDILDNIIEPWDDDE